MGLQQWKDVGNGTEVSRGLSSAQVMCGGELCLQPGGSYSADLVWLWSWLLSVILEHWFDRDQSGLLYHGRALTLHYSDPLVK